jgi:hypothetical protein
MTYLNSVTADNIKMGVDEEMCEAWNYTGSVVSKYASFMNTGNESSGPRTGENFM